MPRRPGRPSVAAITLLATMAAAPLLVGASPALGAATHPCHVTDLTRGGTSGSLQAAVTRADPGDTLQVTGTCAGTTTIKKDLIVKGKRMPSTGKPILDGKGAGTVVRIGRLASVKLVGLTVRNGAALGADWPYQSGGGIFNAGTLRLEHMEVRDNKARVSGGGIRSQGPITIVDSGIIDNRITELNGDGCGLAVESTTAVLAGATVVASNRAAPSASCTGGGVAAWGASTVTIGGYTYVAFNIARGGDGGGIRVAAGASVTIKANAQVYNNVTDNDGGGAWADGTLTVQGHAIITTNTAAAGGGVWATCDATIAIPAPTLGFVHDNTPDDIHPAC